MISSHGRFLLFAFQATYSKFAWGEYQRWVMSVTDKQFTKLNEGKGWIPSVYKTLFEHKLLLIKHTYKMYEIQILDLQTQQTQVIFSTSRYVEDHLCLANNYLLLLTTTKGSRFAKLVLLKIDPTSLQSNPLSYDLPVAVYKIPRITSADRTKIIIYKSEGIICYLDTKKRKLEYIHVTDIPKGLSAA